VILGTRSRPGITVDTHFAASPTASLVHEDDPVKIEFQVAE